MSFENWDKIYLKFLKYNKNLQQSSTHIKLLKEEGWKIKIKRVFFGINDVSRKCSKL